jgi:hypothetical protein
MADPLAVHVPQGDKGRPFIFVVDRTSEYIRRSKLGLVVHLEASSTDRV